MHMTIEKENTKTTSEEWVHTLYTVHHYVLYIKKIDILEFIFQPTPAMLAVTDIYCIAIKHNLKSFVKDYLSNKYILRGIED